MWNKGFMLLECLISLVLVSMVVSLVVNITSLTALNYQRMGMYYNE